MECSAAAARLRSQPPVPLSIQLGFHCPPLSSCWAKYCSASAESAARWPAIERTKVEEAGPPAESYAQAAAQRRLSLLPLLLPPLSAFLVLLVPLLLALFSRQPLAFRSSPLSAPHPPVPLALH